MDNLEYLKDRKRIDDERKKNKESLPHYVSEWEIEYRRTKALEIIAEELCKMNNPLIKVEMLKPKIRVRNLDKYMKKTSI